ncbi:MAG: hypothetical protein V3W11_04320 [bacterium]
MANEKFPVSTITLKKMAYGWVFELPDYGGLSNNIGYAAPEEAAAAATSFTVEFNVEKPAGFTGTSAETAPPK